MIRSVLGEFSYKSIAHEPSLLQKIPYEYARKCLQDNVGINNNIKIETLLKVGLPSTIINEYGNKYLYFSHQSFQEYLTAEWLSREEARLKIYAEEMMHILEKEEKNLYCQETKSSIYMDIIQYFNKTTSESFCFYLYQKWKESSVASSSTLAQMMMYEKFGPITMFEDEFYEDFVNYVE